MPDTAGPAGRPPQGWVVVIPVKRLTEAKTRLARPDRTAVALALASDTVAAVHACPQVRATLVVSDDPEAVRRLTPVAVVVPDVPSSGLNPALTHGAAVAAQRWPDCGVAALAADLPALRPDQLGAALEVAAAHPRALVADAAGSGTVLLTARPGVPLAPHFGPGSRAAHAQHGAHDLTDQLATAVPGLRRDVDTVEDLADAEQLGVGPATYALAAAPASTAASTAGAATAASREAPQVVQATVRTWSPDTRSGDAVTDAGQLIELAPDSALGGSLRRLRPGQRVSLTLVEGRVTVVCLVSEAPGNG
jgi:2-phospho-L-lactate guanylyltransferase